MIKKIIPFASFALVTTLALVAAITAIAAPVFTRPAFADSILPAVHITNLTIDNTTYKAGGQVTGSFVIENDDTAFAPGIVYVVDLAGGYQANGLPTTRYDEKTLGTISLDPGQAETIPFTYSIPSGVSGTNMGIRIQARTSTGLDLGWQDDFPITITGGTGFAAVTSDWLTIGTSTYGPSTGPTIYQGQSITYSATLKNSGSAALTFTPHVSIYNMTANSAALDTFDASTTTLAPGATKTLTFNLPTFNYQPLVYAGQITFTDASGNEVVPVRSFRYIVSGDIATAQTITTTIGSLSAGQQFNVTFSYTGGPADINTGTALDGGTAIANVMVYNQDHQLVAEGSEPVSLNDASITPITIPLTANIAATGATVEATITKGNTVLSTYNQKLFNQSSSTPAAPVTPTSGSSTITILLVILAAIVIFLLLVYLLRRRNPPATLAALLIIFLGGSALVFIQSIHADFNVTEVGDCAYVHAQGYTCIPITAANSGQASLENTYANNIIYPKIFVNTPSGTLAAGGTFFVEGSVQYTGCANSGALITLSSTFNNQTDTYQNFHASTNGSSHDTNDYADDYSLGTYPTPTTAGQYQITLDAQDYPYETYLDFGQYAVNTLAETSYDYTKGYAPFTVAQIPSPTVSLYANPNPVDYGTASNLTWVSQNATACAGTGFGTSGAINNTTGVSTGPLTATTTYDINCTGPGGSAVAAVIVGINQSTNPNPNPNPNPNNQPPTVSLYANPNPVNSGDASSLTWTSQNSTSCSGTGFDTSGATSSVSGVSTGPLTSTTTYSINCAGPGGSANSSVVVGVNQSGGNNPPGNNPPGGSTTTPPGGNPSGGNPSGGNAGLDVSCWESGSPSQAAGKNPTGTAFVGEPVTWSSSASAFGGSMTLPLTYKWTGTDISIPGTSGPDYQITYSTIGNKTMTLTVTDSSTTPLTGSAECQANSLNSENPSNILHVILNSSIKEF